MDKLTQLKTIQGISALIILCCVFFLSSCGGSGEGSNETNSDTITDDHPSFIYDNNSPYAKLLSCASENASCKTCSFSDLPFIGDGVTPISVDMIMQRVVVSHTWMGDNFKQVLLALPDDLLQLFASLRAIHIRYDTRPSFYQSATGAMFIDPIYVYQTLEQRDEIDKSPDFRSAFGETLKFDWLWRYMDQGKSIRFNLATTRGVSDLLPSMITLLSHELAHANDLFPFTQLALSSQNTDYCVARQSAVPISNSLASLYPLQSSLMAALAKVNFLGQTATDSQSALTPIEVWNAFDADNANEYYAYTNQYEDLAMVFEEAFVLHYAGFKREIMIIAKAPEGESVWDQPIEAGQGSRIADSLPANRAVFVLKNLLKNPTAAINTLNTSRSYTLTAGQTGNQTDGRQPIQRMSMSPSVPLQQFLNSRHYHGQ